ASRAPSTALTTLGSWPEVSATWATSVDLLKVVLMGLSGAAAATGFFTATLAVAFLATGFFAAVLAGAFFAVAIGVLLLGWLIRMPRGWAAAAAEFSNGGHARHLSRPAAGRSPADGGGTRVARSPVARPGAAAGLLRRSARRTGSRSA